MGRYIQSPAILLAPRCILEVVGGNSCIWTVPSGITNVSFELWGGGGAGGPKCCCYCQSTNGGHGGGYSLKTISTSSGTVFCICAGPGGARFYCASSATGCAGATSYVTGTGLSNLCAVGGGGGASGTFYCYYVCTCCGGAAYGGDINMQSGRTWNKNRGGCNYMAAGGPSPFGGGESYLHYQQCCPYMSCGYDGVYPGGGGTGIVNCCCDCCGCNGAGAPGLVRITF